MDGSFGAEQYEITHIVLASLPVHNPPGKTRN